jgi:hypothetical protein
MGSLFLGTDVFQMLAYRATGGIFITLHLERDIGVLSLTADRSSLAAENIA